MRVEATDLAFLVARAFNRAVPIDRAKMAKISAASCPSGCTRRSSIHLGVEDQVEPVR
jgi:hypothetical protein